MREYLLIVAGLVAVFGLPLASVELAANTTEWVQVEDPDCILRVYEDKRLIGPDTTTRETYCKQ